MNCENGFTMTYGSMDLGGKTPTFGGYSNQVVVDEHFVLNVPDGLDPAASARLLRAGITTYSPLRQVGINKGSRVATHRQQPAIRRYHHDVEILRTYR